MVRRIRLRQNRALLSGVLLLFAFPAVPVAVAKAKAAVAETIVFPQQESDLKPDPAARFGRLENGVRYIILSNREPKDRVSLTPDTNPPPIGFTLFWKLMASEAT